MKSLSDILEIMLFSLIQYILSNGILILAYAVESVYLLPNPQYIGHVFEGKT